MNKRILGALLCWLSLLTFGAQAQTTTLATETFEAAGTDFGYSSNSFNISSIEYFERRMFTGTGTYTGTTQVLSNRQGSYTWTGEGVRGTGPTNDRSPGYVVLNPITNSANYKNFVITVAFAAPRGGTFAGAGSDVVSSTDRIRIQYSFNGGAWTTAALLMGNNRVFQNASDFEQIVPLSDSVTVGNGSSTPPNPGTILDQTYRDITATLPSTAIGANLRVRVVLDVKLVEVAFDNIRVTGVLDNVAKPTLNNLETTVASYTEGGSPVQLTNTLTVGYSDGSATTLSGGSVTIGNFVAQDFLAFTNQNGITGSYNTSNGVLTLSGTATQAAYQAALRSVTYSSFNTATLATGTRTIGFLVNNGATGSGTSSRQLAVIAALNAPVGLNYTESFDTDGEGTRYFGNPFVSTSSLTGFFRATTSPATANGTTIGSGNFTGWSGGYWFGEGNDSPSNPTSPTSTVQLAPVNASGRSNIRFTIALGAAGNWLGYQNGANPGDSFELFYRINGGTPVKFGAFYGVSGASAPARQDTDLDRLTPATGTQLTSALQDFTFTLPASAAVGNLDFLLVQAARAESEIAFDNIRITAAVPPTVATGAVSNLTTTSATVAGTLSADGGAALTSYGVVYVPGTGTPTTSNSVAVVGTSSPGSFPANFTANLAGLLAGTQYTARAYATNAAGTSYGSNVTFTTNTTVTSIDRASTNPTNAATVSYTVTFANSVSGLSVSNFSLTTTGLTGATISSVAAGSGTTYTVVVNTGTGSGTLTLNLANSTNLSPGVSGLPFAGQTYNIDKTAPTVSSVSVPTNATYRAGQTLSFTVNFSEAVTVTGTPQLSLTIGSTSRQAGYVSGSGTAALVFTYPVQSGDLDTDGIALASALTLNGGTIQDAVGNNATLTLNNVASTTGVLVDAVAPTVTISSSLGASGSSTTTTPLTFSVSFSEPVTGFAATDISVTNGTVVGGSLSGSGAGPYTFSVTPTAAGTATTVAIVANATQDAAGNGSTASSTYSLTYAPATAPTVTTDTPGSITGTSAVLGGNVTASGSATVTDRGVVYVMGNGTPTTSDTKVQIGSGMGAFSQMVTGLRGNTLYTVRAYAISSAGTAYGANQPFTTPNNPPTANPDAMTVAEDSGPTVISVLANDNTLPDVGETLTITSTTQPANGTVTINAGTTVSFAPALNFNGQTTFTYTISDGNGGTATATVTVTVTAVNDAPVVTSTAGNTTYTTGAGTVAVDNGLTVTDVDNTTLTSAVVSISSGFVSGQDALSVTVSGSVGSVYNSATGTLTLTGTATVAQYQAILRSVTYNNASATPNTATRTLSFTVNDGSLNSAVATKNVSFSATTTVVSITANGPSPTNASTVSYTVTFANAVTGVSASNFTLITSNLTGFSVAPVTGSGTTYVVTVNTGTLTNSSLPGSVQIQFNNSTGISPVVTNTGFNSPTYVIDRTAPTATISSSLGASGSTTTTTPLTFSVSFSESVTGFSVAGITVTNGTVTSGSLSGSGSGPYTFTVTPTTAGTATTVTIAANAAQDAVGNGNVASSPYSLTYVAPVTMTTWTGNVSQDWFTAGNWTAGVPTSTIDALIPTGRPFYPVIGSGNAATRDLTNNGSITQGAGTITVSGALTTSGNITRAAGTIAVANTLTNTGTLTQSGGDITVGGSLTNGGTITHVGGTIAISGNLTNNATFTTVNAQGNGGTVLLGAGSTTSNILGSQAIRFWNLTVQAGGAQLSTSAGASMQRVLTLTGNFATQGNVFTIESNSTGDALVVNSGGVVVGNTTVQRYINPSVNPGLGYRHYSAPVSNSNVADLMTTGFTPVINPNYNTSATPTAEVPFPNVFGYDEQRVLLSNNLDSFDKGFFSPLTLSDPLVVGRGYTVNINYNQVVDFVGTLNNNAIMVGMTSQRNTNTEAGWHLLGNPYPAPLNYSLVATADKVNLDGAIYVYSSTSQYVGNYRVYNNGIGNPIVPMGQGFFARVAVGAASGSLTFRNSQRLTVPNATTFQRPAETRPLVQLTLQGAGSPLTDELYVYTQAGATASFDTDFDALKLPNSTGLNLSSQALGQQLAIDGQPELGTAQRIVPLAVGVPAPGSYTLVATQLLNLTNVPVYLRDRQTGALIDLTQQPSYSFVVSNATALLTGRFELVFSPQQVLATVPAALAQQVLVYPNPATSAVAIELPLSLSHQSVTATLLDAVGRTVRTQVLPAGLASHTLLVNDLATGVYALRLNTEAGLLVRKLVIE